MKKKLKVYTEAELQDALDYLRDMTNTYYGKINLALEYLPRIRHAYELFSDNMAFLDNFGIAEDKEAYASNDRATLKQLAKEYRHAWGIAAYYNKGLKCAINKTRYILRNSAALVNSPAFDKLKEYLPFACAFLRKTQTRRISNAVRAADVIAKKIAAL